MARKPSLRRSLPAEFNKLGEHFHQDLVFTPDTLADMAAQLARSFSDRERPVLRAFLTDLIDSASTEEVNHLWNAVCTDWWFEGGEGVRQLLAAIRDALGQGRTRPGWVAANTGRSHGRRVPAPKRR